MPAWAWVIVVLVLVAAVTMYFVRSLPRRRSQALREHFGPEYERAVQEQGGDEKAAEAELAARQERRSTLDIRPLSDRSRREYGERWARTQAMFVDSPQLATAEADMLVQSVMRDRGYPVTDEEERLADVSVDHPDVMDRYRLATAIAVEAREDRATTERLRQALVHYRELFDRLLADEGESSDRRSA